MFNEPKPQNKINEYITRYKNGESLESFGNIPESWKDEILASDEKLELYQVKGFNDIKEVLEEKGENFYFLTHITAPDTAKNIFDSNFTYNLGTGLSGTMSFGGSHLASSQIDLISRGESPHRGLSGVVILALPKKIINNYIQGGKINTDTVEAFLIENYTKEMSGGKIPRKYNFGYFDGETLFYKK